MSIPTDNLHFRTDDLRINRLRQVVAPAILMEQVPISEKAARLVSESRKTAEAILAGKEDRLLVVVGPCSIHDPGAALEYARNLHEFAGSVRDELFLIMRVYFEKPRTTIGWKGLINDPDLDHSYNINKGLYTARKLLLDLAEMGVPAGNEFLDTITPQFYADLVSWGAIGARTTESQVHRELASGLSCPVGFKNGTTGNYQIAIDAIKAASKPHYFLSVTKSGTAAIVETAGNDACHVILRGGSSAPNYDNESIRQVKRDLEAAGLPGYLMVDCSHANSGKNFRNQPGVAAELAAQLAHGEMAISSVMIESNLKAGCQKIGDPAKLEYGISVTDACVSWETTREMLIGLAEGVHRRRKTFLA